MPSHPQDGLPELRRQVFDIEVERQTDQAQQRLQELLRQVCEHAEGDERAALEALIHARLAEVLRIQGQLQEAFGQGLEADTLAQLSGDDEARALAALACGHVFHQVGHFDEARRRLAIVDQLDGAPLRLKARARMNVASLLRAEERLDEAAAAFDQILPVRAVLDASLRTSLLINAASCYQQLGRVDDAHAALDETRSLLGQVGRPDLGVWADAIGAWVHSRSRQAEPALEQARAALATGRPGATLAARSSAARAMADLAAWYGRDSVRAEAIVALEHLLEQAEQVHALADSRELHLSLATLCEVEGDLARAVRHLREARRLEVSLSQQGESLRLEHEALRVELVRMQVEAESLRSHQARLARANQALLAADTARSRLLATLAHDLRSPLTSVLALVDLIEAEDPDSVRRGLGTLSRTVDRMVELLDGALSPLPRAVQDTVDLAHTAQCSVESFQALAHRKHQHIDVQAPTPAPVQADEISLGRLVDNLLSNALKYGPRGGTVQLRVHTERGRAQLEVLDQGPGFPGLDPADGLLYGYQLSSRATGGEESWGLGLHTVYQLLAELGGILALGNRPEGGAVVRVTLPQG